MIAPKDSTWPAIGRATSRTSTGGGTTAGPDEGWTEVEIPIESVEAAVPELLKLGAAIEVLGPEERRTAVVRTLRAMNHTDGV
ncbi:hypothetical protein [Amycolatopsis sp. CA-126428]|uniref:hypothetical protein n=1 Tax=Amycolatopsis sp. CA-126428 TaxID=2073158 RepID=UPI003F8D6654